jgi:hypothetical protein
MKPEANLSLFETPQELAITQMENSSLKEETPKPSLDACPRCGRAGLRSVRPMEYGGKTHYCPQCPGAEPGEPLRWMAQ